MQQIPRATSVRPWRLSLPAKQLSKLRRSIMRFLQALHQLQYNKLQPSPKTRALHSCIRVTLSWDWNYFHARKYRTPPQIYGAKERNRLVDFDTYQLNFIRIARLPVNISIRWNCCSNKAWKWNNFNSKFDPQCSHLQALVSLVVKMVLKIARKCSHWTLHSCYEQFSQLSFIFEKKVTFSWHFPEFVQYCTDACFALHVLNCTRSSPVTIGHS